MLKFAEMLKENSSSFVFLDCEKKKKGKSFFRLEGKKSSLCLNTEILFMAAQLLTCECLHSHFLLPAAQRDALNAPERKGSFSNSFLTCSHILGEKLIKEKRLEQTLTLHRSGDIWKDLNLNRTYRFKVDLKRKFLSSDHNNFVLLAFS